MLFDWLIIGQVAPSNPASVVRGPKYVAKTGKTLVLVPIETRADLHPHLFLRLDHGGADDES